MEHAQRKAFLDTRNCIAARLEIEDENEKLEWLLLLVLPHHVAVEIKADIMSPAEGQFHKIDRNPATRECRHFVCRYRRLHGAGVAVHRSGAGPSTQRTFRPIRSVGQCKSSGRILPAGFFRPDSSGILTLNHANVLFSRDEGFDESADRTPRLERSGWLLWSRDNETLPTIYLNF